MKKSRLPVFVLCEDGHFYEDLVYGDDPARHAWFLCFDPVEPAEIVIKESAFNMGMTPKEILSHRGFDNILAGLAEGRKDSHIRYFGGSDCQGRPLDPVPAISWFCRWKRGMRFPKPCKYDQCVDDLGIFLPGRRGIVFGQNL